MLTYSQALFLGLVQGLTELFPISSLGHSVLIPALLQWKLDEHAQYFVLFLVATHLATALVLVAFFWQDWLKVAQGFVRLCIRFVTKGAFDSGDTYARLSWLLIVATIPAGMFQPTVGLLVARTIHQDH